MNIWKTPGLSLQLIQGICKKHGISSRCNLITDRSQLVFASEDQLVIKVFSPEEPDFCQNERIFLKQLHQQLPIPTPISMLPVPRRDTGILLWNNSREYRWSKPGTHLPQPTVAASSLNWDGLSGRCMHYRWNPSPLPPLNGGL